MSAPTAPPVTSDDAKFQSALLTAAIPFIFLCICFLCIRAKLPQVYLPNGPDVVEKLKRKSEDEDERPGGGSRPEGPDAGLIQAEDRNPDGSKKSGALEGGIQAVGGAIGSTFSLLDIFKTIWKLDMRDIEDIAGFDAMTFSYMLWFQFCVMAMCLPLAFIILVPLYATDDNKDDAVTLDYMTLSNVTNGDWRMWGTIVVAILMYGGSTWTLQRAFKELSERADSFNAYPTESHYTVLLTNIWREKFLDPATGTTALREFFNGLFPNGIVNIEMCKDVTGIQKPYNKYIKARDKRRMAEKADDHEVGCCCCKKTLDQCIDEEAAARQDFFQFKCAEIENTAAAIIQFDAMQKASICKSVPLVPGGEEMQCRAVPENADEIIWENIGIDPKRRKAGEICGFIAYALLIIISAAPLVTIQGLSNLDELANEYNLDWIQDLPTWLLALLQGSAPAILFSIYFAILPYFISALTKLVKLPFTTDQTKLSLARYTDCLILLGLLLSVVASGIFSNINNLTKLSASEIWDAFGSTLPSQSVFYINYVITAAFLALGKELVLLVPLIKNCIGMWTHDNFDYYTKYAIAIMMFVICTTYAVIAPFILIWGALYFFIAYFTFTYQLVYVYKKGNDTGGALFPTVFSKLLSGLVIGQVVVIAMFVLKEGIAQAVLFIAVPIYTLVTRSTSLSRYAIYFNMSSLETMQEEDDDVINDPAVRPGENSFVAPAIDQLRNPDDPEDVVQQDAPKKSSSEASLQPTNRNEQI